MNGVELARAFEDLTLDAEKFNHEQHLLLAWHYLRHNPLPEAMILLRDGLLKLTAHLGATDKYHETITFAILMLVFERKNHGHEDDFETFKTANPDLFNNWRMLMESYYSKTLMDSERARKQFVMPDRVAALV